MKLFGKAVFGAALAAMLGTGQAWAICAANTGVTGTATQTSQTTWTYDFSVLNGCAPGNQPFMTDFYIPYFADAGIADITLPQPDTTSTTSTITWTYSIDPNDDLFDLPGAGVIDFQVTATPELEANANQDSPGVGYYGASGFSFTSTFAPVEGPNAVLRLLPPDYVDTSTVFGDPPIPGSPDTIAALEGTASPEPGAAELLAIGLCLVTLVLKLRRRAARRAHRA